MSTKLMNNHEAVKSEVKRRRILDIQTAYRIDNAFRSSIDKLQAIKPKNVMEITNHLNNKCYFKLPMNKTSMEILSLKSSKWKEFIDECIEANDDSDCCFLENLIRLLQSDICPSCFGSVKEMVVKLTSSFHFIDFIVNGGKCSRPDPSAFNKKHSYYTYVNEVPVIQGIDKVLNNFNKDPEQENVEKTPWDAFEYLYGDSEMFLGYTAIGGERLLHLKLGCLIKNSKGFEIFQELNVFNSDDQATLLRTWVLLIPIVKGIVECIQQRQKKLPGLMSRDINQRIGNITVAELRKEIISIHGITLFMKTWTFTNDEDTKEFYNKQRAILDVISDAKNGFLKESSGAYEKLHICKKDNYRLSCVFRPFCYPVPSKHSSTAICYWIRQLCDLVQFLHDHNIVHNDIKMLNLMLISEYIGQNPPPQLVLIDYDVCSPLTNDSTMGLCLNIVDHAPNIRSPHGKEVDIWGIGNVLNNWASSLHATDERDKFMRRGQHIQDYYETIYLDDIRNDLV